MTARNARGGPAEPGAVNLLQPAPGNRRDSPSIPERRRQSRERVRSENIVRIQKHESVAGRLRRAEVSRRGGLPKILRKRANARIQGRHLFSQSQAAVGRGVVDDDDFMRRKTLIER